MGEVVRRKTSVSYGRQALSLFGHWISMFSFYLATWLALLLLQIIGNAVNIGLTIYEADVFSEWWPYECTRWDPVICRHARIQPGVFMISSCQLFVWCVGLTESFFLHLYFKIVSLESLLNLLNRKELRLEPDGQPTIPPRSVSDQFCTIYDHPVPISHFV